jgi:hypothetical protein
MFDLIPAPYRIAAATIASIALFMSGLTIGIKWKSGRNAEALLQAQQEYQVKYKKEVEHGNALAAQVEEAKRNIQIKTVEIIKRIPAVTNGRPCLGSDAVSLLNGTSKPTLRETARQPAGESAGAPAASDRDVADWIAVANERYDQCAAQLNGLIDFNLQ